MIAPVNEPGVDQETESAEERIVADRRAKVAAMRAAGQEPYPYRFDEQTPVESVLQAHAALAPGEETDTTYRLAGRLMARRGHGKAMFADLQDRTGRIQLLVTLDRVGQQGLDSFSDLDIGDWIGIEGAVMRTRRGELSLAVTEFQLLAKCLRPLPEKWHGLQDVELRRSQRYLDLAVNRESFDAFIVRSKTVSAFRRLLEDRGFMEVETPVLQPLYGGAAARPFVTFHNELEQNLYLRIATELYLKRLIVGGMEKVFEIGKNFRNEGISYKHNPEFTMLELYEAYADYESVMRLMEEVVAEIAKQVTGSTVVNFAETEIDLEPPWRRLSLRDAILEQAGVDIALRDVAALRERLQREGADTASSSTYGQLVDDLLSKFVEPRLLQPTFLVDYPVELSPFARRQPDDELQVQRFEAFVGGMEIANAFSELNDPDDQHARFVQQSEAREQGDELTESLDEDYIRALEFGMPPTGGLGVGIDRLTMLLTGQSSIRDVVLFPARRSQQPS